MNITDPTLKRLLLEHLVERMEGGDDELVDLLNSGINPDLLDVLRHREARDFLLVSRMGLSIRVELDSGAVMSCFRRLDAMRARDGLCEYFVRHGAPDAMMTTFFKTSRKELRRLRSLLTPGALPPGPSKLPPPDQRQRICDEWSRIQREQPAAPTSEALHRLHQAHPQYSLAALWAALTEFGAVPELGAAPVLRAAAR